MPEKYETRPCIQAYGNVSILLETLRWMESIYLGFSDSSDSHCKHAFESYSSTKLSQAEKKFQRLVEYNYQLRESLAKERIPVSHAASDLIRFVSSTPDPLVPAVWGERAEDPFKENGSCCNIV
ncbi:hypothetical protein HDU97_009173 [Phlyctochytrium planicorne]|nr:hypothetical protein HDU97_009173 [Phlyctochytrium planicorne]